jgi:hypothetical protein
MDKTKWKSIVLPKSTVDQLDDFSESKIATSYGFTNKSQIASIAIREFLRNYSSYQTYLDYLGFEKKIIKIMDHELGKTVEIKLDSENTTLFCKNHNSDYCNHIRFVWTLPRFKEELKKFKKPIQKVISKVYTKEDILDGLQIPIRQSIYNKLKDEKIVKKKMIEILKEITKDLEK